MATPPSAAATTVRIKTSRRTCRRSLSPTSRAFSAIFPRFASPPATPLLPEIRRRSGWRRRRGYFEIIYRSEPQDILLHRKWLVAKAEVEDGAAPAVRRFSMNVLRTLRYTLRKRGPRGQDDGSTGRTKNSGPRPAAVGVGGAPVRHGHGLLADGRTDGSRDDGGDDADPGNGRRRNAAAVDRSSGGDAGRSGAATGRVHVGLRRSPVRNGAGLLAGGRTPRAGDDAGGCGERRRRRGRRVPGSASFPDFRRRPIWTESR